MATDNFIGPKSSLIGIVDNVGSIPVPSMEAIVSGITLQVIFVNYTESQKLSSQKNFLIALLSTRLDGYRITKR